MIWVNSGMSTTAPTSTSTTTDYILYTTASGTGTSSTSVTNYNDVIVRQSDRSDYERWAKELEKQRERLKILQPGKNYDLPDGSKIAIDMNGNFEIVDRNAKVTYQANRKREFNPFINASDLLEQFIHDVGELGVRQCEVLAIPIELFINWLVIKAAEQDGDPMPDIPQLEAPKKHRCKWCGHFLSNDMKSKKIDFCNGSHMDRYLEKVA